MGAYAVQFGALGEGLHAAVDGAGVQSDHEIARLARLAARPGHQLPLFAALTVAVEDERELSRGGVIDDS